MTDKMSTAADLVRRAYKVNTRLAALNAEKDGIVAALLALGWESGKVTTSAGPFTVSEVNRYDQNAMLAALKPGQANLCFKPKTLDPAKVKALYPETYAAAKANNGQKVTF